MAISSHYVFLMPSNSFIKRFIFDWLTPVAAFHRQEIEFHRAAACLGSAPQ